MLDIKIIRDNPEDVKARLKAKEVDCDAAVDRILELDAERRELIFKTENAKSEQNKATKQIPAMKKAGEDTSAVFARMNELKEAIKSGNVDEIKAKQDEVQKAFYPIAEKMYKEAGAQQAQQGQQPQQDQYNAGQQSANDDGVVDADFKEV